MWTAPDTPEWNVCIWVTFPDMTQEKRKVINSHQDKQLFVTLLGVEPGDKSIFYRSVKQPLHTPQMLQLWPGLMLQVRKWNKCVILGVKDHEQQHISQFITWWKSVVSFILHFSCHAAPSPRFTRSSICFTVLMVVTWRQPKINLHFIPSCTL